MAKRDYYEVLGVVRQASVEEIKKVFRSKARNLHPDNKHSGDEAAFKELLKLMKFFVMNKSVLFTIVLVMKV